MAAARATHDRVPSGGAGGPPSPRPRYMDRVHPGGLVIAAICVVGAAAAVLSDPVAVSAWLHHPALGARGEAMAVRGAQSLRVVAPVALLTAAALVLALAVRRRSIAAPTPTVEQPAPSCAPFAVAAQVLPAHGPITRFEGLVLAALTVLGGVLRVDRAFESLWYDEIAAFMDYAQHGPGPIVGTWFSPANHPLQSLLSWCSFSALGSGNEFTIRLPSLVAALLTIPSVWWMVRPALGQRIALLAAAGMAIAPAAILGSVEARGYSIMMLAGALLTGIAWRAVVRERAGQHAFALWCVYAAVAAMGVWAHFTLVLVPIGHGLVAATLGGRGEWRLAARWLMALVIAAALVVALLSPVLPWMIELRGELAASDGNEPTLWSREGAAILGTWGGAWVWWPSLLGGALAAIGACSIWRRAGDKRLLLALGVVPFLMGLAVPLAGSWIYARFLAFAIPAAAMLWGAGLDTLRRRGRVPALAFGGVLAASWLLLLTSLPPKQPLRDMVALAAEQTGPVIVVGLPDEVVRFYAGPLGLDARYAKPYGADLAELLAATPGARVLVLYPEAMPERVSRALTDARFALVHAEPGWADWGAGGVQLFAADPNAAPR